LISGARGLNWSWEYFDKEFGTIERCYSDQSHMPSLLRFVGRTVFGRSNWAGTEAEVSLHCILSGGHHLGQRREGDWRPAGRRHGTSKSIISNIYMLCHNPSLHVVLRSTIEALCIG
jgi:hypothetical protein